MTPWLIKYRLIALAATTFFSLIVLAVSAAYLAKTKSLGFEADTFNLFDVAVSVITLVTIPIMMLVDRMRRGAFTSKIVIELAWFGILAVLWLAAASFTSNQISGLVTLCKFDRDSTLRALCKESQTAAAFGWLAWLCLTGYTVTLLVTSVISHNHGSTVWHSTVRDAKFEGDHAVAQNLASRAMNLVMSEAKEAVTGKESEPRKEGNGAQQQHQQYPPALPYTGAPAQQTPTGTPTPVYQQPQVQHPIPQQPQQMYQQSPQPTHQQPLPHQPEAQQPNPAGYHNV